MKCKVYGCKIGKCFCADEECCTRVDCSGCAKIANDQIKELVERNKNMSPEEIRAWAERLADDSMKIEEKYGDT